MKKKKSFFLSIFFIIFIFSGLLLNTNNIKTNFLKNQDNIKEHKIKMAIKDFEKSFNVSFVGRMEAVDINGLFKKMAQQKNVNETILGSSTKLYNMEVVNAKYSPKKEEKNLQYTKKLMDYAKAKGVKTLYVQHPDKYDENKDKLPYGKNIVQSQIDNYWVSNLEKEKYNVLDLRKGKYKAKEFYKTDHHWTNESSINASKAIMEFLNFDADVCNIENYVKVNYEDSFLGASGVRVGKYYIGKDDFVLLIPKFETNLKYTHFIDGEKSIEKIGTFEESLIDQEILRNVKYNNKYNTFLNGGYVENIIENRGVEDKKLLLVSDSFARPMAQYLSLGFSQTRYLDPQEGRYNESLIQYIDEYKPDVLVIMYNYGFSDKTLGIDNIN